MALKWRTISKKKELYLNLLIIFLARKYTPILTSTHGLIESIPNICGEKFFTRANISTNVDTLLKGTHITIKWNKEREYIPHATLFIEKKSNIGRLRHGVCKSQNLGHPICFRVITHISFCEYSTYIE